MRKPIDIEQEYYCAGCDNFEPDIVKLRADNRVIIQYLVCTHADDCHRLHEHIQARTDFELDKAKARIAELEYKLSGYDAWWEEQYEILHNSQT